MPKKDVLTETTEAAVEKVTASVTAQADLLNKCYALYQAQSEKAVKFWMDSAAQAMADGQKAVKEWADLTTELLGDTRKNLEANVKEATKMFTPAA
jgi:CHASE3 domain sensor protein